LNGNGLVDAALEGTQKVDDFLLFLNGQLIEMVDDPIGLAASALVSPDGLNEVGRASVMEKEDALSDAPQRGGSEFVRASGALGDAVGEAFAHVVDQEVGPEVRGLVRESSTLDRRGAAGNHFTRG
jgi:hypothetical protein